MEVTLGGISQLSVMLCILIGSIYLAAEGLLTSEQVMTLWGGLLGGMGIGYINGRKT